MTASPPVAAKAAPTVFRPLDGILLLDKPPGMSSNQALQRVRHIYRAEKAGHTGSLDPLATGLLPLCFGEATKIAGLLLGHRKAYETTARLGAVTDTDDADGAVLRERPVPGLTADEVRALLPRFEGRISQRPPIYSALKQGGEPLYAKARRGEAIDVPARQVEVQSVELLELTEATLTLRIACGSGTYVRSIVRDLGELLGCGAHVATLRRLWVDPFTQPRMHTLEALQALREAGDEGALDALLLPVDAGLAGQPECLLDSAQARALWLGQPVRVPVAGAGSAALHVARDPSGRPLGLVHVRPDGRLHVQRLFRWAAAG
jgi:tRNA pseudouridine55 synthase